MPFDEQAAIDEFWNARARGEYFPAAVVRSPDARPGVSHPAWHDRAPHRRGRAADRLEGGPDRGADPAAVRLPRAGVRLHPGQQAVRPRVPPRRADPAWLRAGTVPAGRSGAERRGRCADGARARSTRCIRRWRSSRRAATSPRRSRVAMADNAQQKTVVLGDPVALGDLALEAVAATVRINGETVATGRGDAVLGNPLNSVVWLARKLAEFGRGIQRRRDHHERLVHAAVPDRAGRSDPCGLRRNWRRARHAMWAP